MSWKSADNSAAESVDLVWFSEVQWDFLSTRKQRLLQRFSSRWRILFIEPYALGRSAHWLPVKRGRVVVVTVPFLKTVPFSIGRLLDLAVPRNGIASAGHLVLRFWLMMLGFSSPRRIIGLSNVYWGVVAAGMPCSLRFYDANDDHLSFPGSPSWLPPFLARYLQACSLVFSVSPELTARLQLPEGIRCVELGNGVEYDHFAVDTPEIPSFLAALEGRKLGYAGAMDWVDCELLAGIAGAWPDVHIVLVGPAYERNWWERQEQLRGFSNVHYVGRVDYGDLPTWINGFDLALMPLLRNPLKTVSHPNKLYEYCAAGVPVLAIDYCSALDAARGVIHVARTNEEFIAMIPEALRDNRKAERKAFARQHDWNRLAAEMERELLKSSGRGCL
ncbi:glycosyltransferase [Chlorobium phaeobacteroides]|jgi:glycosyltransferase involved in cell wall biosynthesis|uniref:Glycosyl transferase, group 1 n=1 Tax=Chlorobium phaeobacteroides (strain DSM 266 / SMG 266 / 2430) TaxID=290317 RepID=A1BJ50_CHLPD|nr:glycosyltransferase [Chlorobium phaeobacteroides]ABL66427.1 glycosyl transferase, group 1 [Chlorobium phaeobacteroides DSM 266]MBV5319546.1 glycosyltransferase [Chlorobium phaeobacteroides]